MKKNNFLLVLVCLMFMFNSFNFTEGYTTKFIGSLTHSEYNGINEVITHYVANLDKHLIEDGKIYFDTCVEE